MTRLDADELKESLTVDDVKILLAELGAEDVTHNVGKGELVTNTICHNHSGGSHKLIYYEESHTFHCYTECSCNMSIYSLIMKVYKLRGSSISFPSAIDYVATKTGKSKNVFGQGFLILDEPRKNEDIEWLERFSKPKKIEFSDPEFHSDKILDVFSGHMNHPLFVSDGILPEVMDFYNIRYYDKDERIIIPHRFYKNGKIIALRGRATRESDIQNGVKYLPATIQGKLYSAPTFINLFGLYENKSNIERLKKVAIFESEKSVLQVASMYGNENNFSVALSGKNISNHQVEMLLNLGITEIILCLDKEFKDPTDSEAIRHQKKILEIGRKFSKYVQAFTVWDENGLLDYKQSPSDKNRKVLEQLMKEKKEILNKE